MAQLNAFIEFYQEQKSQKILESFLDLVPKKCFAIREHQLLNILAKELVPGDVVYVRMGDKTPADILVFSSSDFKVPSIFDFCFRIAVAQTPFTSLSP